MQSVADQLRRETQRRLMDQSPEARVDIALRLGDEDVALLCARRGITADDARAVLRRARQTGRARSACAE